MREIVVETEGLKKIYKLGKVDVTALNGIDLKIFRGEYISIMGPSGTGRILQIPPGRGSGTLTTTSPTSLGADSALGFLDGLI